ncbi:MAG: hypothetical protein EXR64_02625 [Dehalococcoidia bacterium]|nr:hypothetical protein [Dehalococcoidia bacterium]
MIIGAAPACATASGIGVGPGIRRFTTAPRNALAKRTREGHAGWGPVHPTKPPHTINERAHHAPIRAAARSTARSGRAPHPTLQSFEEYRATTQRAPPHGAADDPTPRYQTRRQTRPPPGANRRDRPRRARARPPLPRRPAPPRRRRRGLLHLVRLPRHPVMSYR